MNQPILPPNADLRLRMLLEPATSCAGCGSCCELTPTPPFAIGECQQRGIPAEWLQTIERRVAAGQQFEVLPCVWYDSEQRTCEHYEQRPTACREFELGGSACAAARRRVLCHDLASQSLE